MIILTHFPAGILHVIPAFSGESISTPGTNSDMFSPSISSSESTSIKDSKSTRPSPLTSILMPFPPPATHRLPPPSSESASPSVSKSILPLPLTSILTPLPPSNSHLFPLVSSESASTSDSGSLSSPLPISSLESKSLPASKSVLLPLLTISSESKITPDSKYIPPLLLTKTFAPLYSGILHFFVTEVSPVSASCPVAK